MPSSGPHDWIGQTLIDRYHVTETIGAGGMGTVFKASDTRLGAEVVVKVPHPVMIKDAEFAARFKREIQSLVKLSHTNIVKVMDVGEHDGLPFAVMQYLGGGSLEDRTRPCTPEEVSAWLPDAAAALDFMHSAGLIHRDIKPGNILFDLSGHAYLGDFGIAKVMAEGEDSDEKLTGTGSMIGTAEYMAPEMLVPSGFKEAYNQRADQYSLAVTVYEMLAGRPPFRGESMAEVAILLATKNATALQERNPAIPEDVSRVVARALRKQPEQRFESCQEFAGSFVAADSGEGASAVATPTLQEKWSGTADKGRRRTTQAEATGNPATPRTSTIRESSSTLSESVTIPGRVDSSDLLGTRPDRGETVQEQRPLGKDESGGPATGNLFIRRLLPVAATIFTIALVISAAFMLIAVSGGSEDPVANNPDGPDPTVMGPSTNGLPRDTSNPIDLTAIKEYMTPAQLALGDPVVNSVGMLLVPIPAGEFTMGSPATEENRTSHEIPLRVKFTQPFYLGVTEVTQTQYERVMESNPSRYKGAEHPVEWVSWEKAVEFCRKLSALPAEQAAGHQYRLPTEAEWEYACRAGTTTAYGFGEATAALSEYGWFDDNSASSTHPVGGKKPNVWGLYDMHGNVWEMCQDWREDYPSGSVVTDPPTAKTSGLYLGTRGGGGLDVAGNCRSAMRHWGTQVSRDPFCGFRVLRSSIK